ncbi:MAG: DUF2087 domain-containing protein [Pseudomonadales bacterium]|nr:DUF2087 domain-containing protein [Pseudomonadales bacterium]
MNDKQQVERVFARLFNGGLIERVPKRADDAQVFLALAAASLPGAAHAETEVNLHLAAWLEDIVTPVSMDYVTVRRALVDAQFLLRDVSGHRYSPNFRKISSVLTEEAMQVRPVDVMIQVHAEREARRRARVS